MYSVNIDVINKLIENHKYYSKKYKKLNTLVDFENLPIIGKEEAKNILLFSQGEIITRTSGSTGDFLNIMWGEADYLKSLSYIWKIRKTFGVKPSDVFCTNHALMHNTSKLLNIKVIINKNSISFSKIDVSSDSLKRFATEIITCSPKWFLMQPSFVYAIGKYFKNNHMVLPQSLKYIELTGEYLTDEIYNRICMLFPGVTIKNMYGMQEFNGIAIGDCNELKVLDRNVYVEVINKNGKSVLDEEGDIVVSGYSNSRMPLIRYKTGDKGIKTANNTLKITQARSSDVLKLGDRIFDCSVFITLTERINYRFNNNITQFLYVFDKNKLNCFFILQRKEIDQPRLIDLVREQTALLFEYDFAEIKVNIVDSIPVSKKSNKTSYFINKEFAETF